MKTIILVNKENDDPLWPAWFNYHSQFVDEIEIITLRQKDHSYPPRAFANEVSARQTELLKYYDVVLYLDIDEFLIPDPDKYKDLRDYIEKNWNKLPRATGYDLVHNHATDVPIKIGRPLMYQRPFWARDTKDIYSKQIITHQDIKWSPGFHYLEGRSKPNPDPDLILLHVLYCDVDLALKRLRVSHPRMSKTQVLETISRFELAEVPERFKIV